LTHGGENHVQADGDVPAAKRRKKDTGVGTGVGAVEGGGAAPAKAAVPRALPKCGVCPRLKSECKGGPAACPDKRFAKPAVPKAELEVDAGSVLMLYDIETSIAVAGGDTLLNEAGACTAIYVGGNWMLGAEEYKGVTKQKLAQWTRELQGACGGGSGETKRVLSGVGRTQDLRGEDRRQVLGGARHGGRTCG
jgi:hypothetical protein